MHTLISINNSFKFIVTAVFLLNSTTFAYGQNTILSSAIKYRESIVMISAVQQNATSNHPKNPSIKAFHEKKGAGVIINDAGLIITNLHIIYGSEKIGVTLHSGKTYGATLLHYKPEFDLALLKINTSDPLTSIPFADSNTANLGDNIIHIGSSFLLKQTISGGKITAIGHIPNEINPKEREIEFFRININIYKGDSGGPLINYKGELIGIMFAKQVNQDRKAFAIPSNKIKKLYIEYLK